MSLKKKKSNYPNIPFYITAVGQFLQLFSTKWVTQYALHLFMTPMRFKQPKREEPMYYGSKKEFLHVPPINKKVQVYKYGNAVKKVLLVHGWSGRGTQLCSIADKLIHHKYMAVSFDAPAHGNSTGKKTHLGEFIETVKAIDAAYGPFEAIVGHSLGAMATLNAIKQGVKTPKAILIGSADIITDIITGFCKQIKLKSTVAKRLKQLLDKKFNGDVDQFSVSTVAREVHIPVLLIHDTDDMDTSISCSKTICKELTNAELMVTNKLGHRRILGNQKVVEKVLSFISEN